MLAVDDLVGNVKQALEATGRLNNTIFIYTGDNGMMMGEHGLSNKLAPYQTQVPFYLSWPQELGTFPQTSTERIQNIDLAPTLCDIAGCTMPNTNGISFKALLYNSSLTLGRDAVLDELPVKQDAVQAWYSVITTSSSPLASQGCALASTNSCRWQYTEYPVTNESELYDISNGPCYAWNANMTGDPCELDNQASNPIYTSIVDALHQRLAELKAE